MLKMIILDPISERVCAEVHPSWSGAPQTVSTERTLKKNIRCMGNNTVTAHVHVYAHVHADKINE